MGNSHRELPQPPQQAHDPITASGVPLPTAAPRGCCRPAGLPLAWALGPRRPHLIPCPCGSPCPSASPLTPGPEAEPESPPFRQGALGAELVLASAPSSDAWRPKLWAHNLTGHKSLLSPGLPPPPWCPPSLQWQQ